MQFEIENGVLVRCISEKENSETTVVIPEHVSKIGRYAFYHAAMSEIYLPDSLQVIEQEAFRGCMHLKHVTIPSGVHTIGASAFAFCKELTSFTVPDSLEHCANNVLYRCTRLQLLTLYRQDGSQFHFTLENGWYAEGILTFLLGQPQGIHLPTDHKYHLLSQAISNGYRKAEDAAAHLLHLAVQMCLDKQEPQCYAMLKKLLEDEQQMKRVDLLTFEEAITFANKRQNYDVQLMLMDAVKRYNIGGDTERFQL